VRANEGSHAFTGSVGPAQVVYVGLGRLPKDDTDNPTADDFAGKDLHGKIALIQRGTIFFERKINNAAKAGAIGAVIYDNQNELNLLSMDVKTATLPAMSISQDSGKTLLAFVQAHPDAQVTLHSETTTFEETPNVLTDFSSRGYAADYAIKPDLVAPGQDIYSATTSVPNSEIYSPSGWATEQGTSFSAPHVAGAAALVLQKHPLHARHGEGPAGADSWSECNSGPADQAGSLHCTDGRWPAERGIGALR
jgi:subtilisin family serine protease